MVFVSSSNPHNKEISIRRMISSIFNKREDDFPSLIKYNDYLEEVEDMTFNLIEGIDIPAIEAKIANYTEENSEQIMINRAWKAEELVAAIAASKEIPAQTETDRDPASSSQEGFSITAQGQYAPTIAGGQPRPMGIPPQPVHVGGGLDMQGFDDEQMMKLRAERGGKAGGWSIELSKKRSFDVAFTSLWV